MYGAVLSSAAATRVGLHPYEAPTAANSVPYDGRPACNNCGFCAYFGCPIHAKGDPVALLTKTMATGRAELLAETYVSRIRIEGRRAKGVDYIGPDGVERSMEAKVVVVAGGAIETPRLLLMSGLEHPALGRHLMVHFQTIVVGHFEDLRLHPYKGRSVTHVHDDAMVQDEGSRAAAADAGLPWIRGGLVEHAGGGFLIGSARHMPWGKAHAEAMRASTFDEHLWAFIMQGEDLAYPTNTVDLSPSIRDARGFPVARITYRPGRHELVASGHHGQILLSVLDEMGADWTIRTSSPVVGEAGLGTSPIPESRHVMGTARMGDDPDTTVVDRWGRVHTLDNVVVADSSVFATSAGYGPTLTLVALASRAAHHLAGTAPD
jgi:gluconate 2-dehydrogenase alpha chain